MCSLSLPHQDIFYINAIALATCKARHFGYAIRKDNYPREVMGLFGLVAPSNEHAKRICKILRFESWRQVRLLEVCLKVWCYRASRDKYAAEKKLRLCRREFAIVTNFLWERLRASFPKTPRCAQSGEENVVFLWEASAPVSVVNVFAKGPKFATEPLVKPPEILALVRQVSDKASPANRKRCILDCLDGLMRGDRRPVQRKSFGAVVSFFNDSNLKLLVSDKEGGFAVVPEDMYNERAKEAVLKNFKPLSGIVLKKVKARAV
ncbi:hypothetical protein HPB47_014227 [Ixodes persulcatus]|uniref:Uncharacterized protein n=1 Tax=Ixodes persulcatus TaxID=34615 RepID=A0AC60R1H6_IXOPE|nr:hypothetical protein HPB47_014227 [Ixodes persulcatus]